MSAALPPATLAERRQIDAVNRALLKACTKGDLEVAATLLAQGAHPQLWDERTQTSALGQLMAARERQGLDAQPAWDLFVRHHVNLAEEGVRYDASACASGVLWADRTLRHHPRIGPLAWTQAKLRWVAQAKSNPEAAKAQWVETYARMSGASDHGWRAAWRAVRPSGIAPADLCEHALLKGWPALFVHEALAEAPPPDPAQLLPKLFGRRPSSSLDHLPCLAGWRAWIQALPRAQQSSAWLGVEGAYPGLLRHAMPSRHETAPDGVCWRDAVRNPQVRAALDAGCVGSWSVWLGLGLTTVSGPQSTTALMEWIHAARAAGQWSAQDDVWSPANAWVSRQPGKDVLCTLPRDPAWGDWHPRDALQAHLARPWPRKASARLCAFLVQAGVLPSVEAAALVCAQVRTHPDLETWSPLLRRWVRQGLPSTLPDGRPWTAWMRTDLARPSSLRETLAQRLEQWQLQRALPCAAAQASARPRF